MASCSECYEEKDNVLMYPYNNIGSKWTYSVYDSLRQRSYTETVEITGTTQLNNNGMSAKVFKSTFSSNEDSVAYSFLTENADTLTYWIICEYCTTAMTWYLIDRMYVYPFEVGSQWHSQRVDDSYKVVSLENTTVPAGNFIAFKIIRQIKEPNFLYTENEWYSPSIGMIRRDYFSRNLGMPENKSYQLISYQLK